MNRDWVVDVVARLPQGMVSRAWGWLARRKHPRVGIDLLKRSFVAATGIDMGEAADSMSEYRTLEELFVRPLKAGARRVDPDPEAVVSPVDGAVGACGVIEEGCAFQVKGRQYSVARLLASAAEAERFEGGHYVTLYLSPKDYHRIHAPVAGTVPRARVIPGALMPVFHESLEKVDELFARNERLVSFLDHERLGRVAVVKVGATLVGRISVAYDESLRSNDPTVAHLDRDYDPPPAVQKGGELGAFELGSTVVLLFEPGAIKLETLPVGSPVRLGERIATLRPAKARAKAKPKATPKSATPSEVKPPPDGAAAKTRKKTSKKTASTKASKKKTAPKKTAKGKGSVASAGEKSEKKTSASGVRKAKASTKKTSVKKTVAKKSTTRKKKSP